MKTFNFLNVLDFSKAKNYLSLPKVKSEISKTSTAQESEIKKNHPEEKKVELPRYLLI